MMDVPDRRNGLAKLVMQLASILDERRGCFRGWQTTFAVKDWLLC